MLGFRRRQAFPYFAPHRCPHCNAKRAPGHSMPQYSCGLHITTRGNQPWHRVHECNIHIRHRRPHRAMEAT